MTTLPAGIPRLDALVRAEAERKAAERYAIWCREIARRGRGPVLHWSLLTDADRKIDIDTEAALLRDLTRPESRDWAVRAGFDLDCNAHPEQGPFFDGLRDDWNNRRDDPTALAQALAAVCRNA